MVLSKFRVKFNIFDGSDLEKMRRSNYRFILLDTCFIVDRINALPKLCSIETIKETAKIPAICDFVEAELKTIAYVKNNVQKLLLTNSPRRSENNLRESWSRYLKFVESTSTIIGIVTGALTKKELANLLNQLDRKVRKVLLKSYSGLKDKGNPVDLGLIAVAVILTSSGIPSGIATKDRRLESTVSLLERLGYDIEFWRRPWNAVNSS